MTNKAKKQRRRLIEAALVILRRKLKTSATKKPLGFDMSRYVQSDVAIWSTPAETQHECATACCFLGHVAALEPACANMNEFGDWRDVAALCGVCAGTPAWDWLFSEYWSSNRTLNAVRLIGYLENSLLYQSWYTALAASEVEDLVAGFEKRLRKLKYTVATAKAALLKRLEELK